MKKITSFFLAMFLMVAVANAQKMTPEQEAAYTKAITQRADKIITSLGISDSSRAIKVRDIIAGQYRDLNEIYTDRDNKLKAAKQKFASDKEALAKEVKSIQDDATARVDKLHGKYISKLSSKLDKDQVVKVKDGMTYNVLPITYTGYQQMILNLTDEQKAKILEWLTEAREHAMDAESSDKKHAWFGKYKGRINNYLSAQGYNLKKEGDEWEKRRKASASN